MEVELTGQLHGKKLEKWKQFLQKAGLDSNEQTQRIVLVWDGDDLIATGARQNNLLKCIAVDEAHQGEGLTATVLTQLRQDAFREGYDHLFLYTKPQNLLMFSSLFFYPIAQTAQVLLMEDKKDGIDTFLQNLPAEHGGAIGAVVMNCNPFTKGHRYLIETAAKECDHLYVFVLSEDQSDFSSKDRTEMVKLGTKDLPNVSVLPTGPYLISAATFPTYFLKDRDAAEKVHCALDVEIFCKYFAPKFGITRRYVGTEPLSPMTNQYNEILSQKLPENGIALRQISRLEQNGTPISASAVRACLRSGDTDGLQALIPETTYTYLKNHDFIK